MMQEKRNGEKLVEECLRILSQESSEGTQKWIKESRITSLTLRNVKALEVISLSNYLLQKHLLAPSPLPHHLLALLCDYHKKQASKCHEYARLLKHFSQWDYEFEYIHAVALGQQLGQLGLYLRVREAVVHSEFNRGKKELLSGIWAELEEWAGLARSIFKEQEETDVIDQFTTVVKHHYVQVKKSQSEKINGAEFLRICQIIGRGQEAPPPSSSQGQPPGQRATREPDPVAGIFEETVLNGLSTQDKELIRVLSYRDKNIARMLEEKHTKMVHLIGEEVYALRKDINREKERYVEVVEEKNSLLRLIERLKESTLRYVLDPHEAIEFEVLQQLDSYNKKHNPKAGDVARTIEVINNRRLIQIIEQEELEPDHPDPH